MRGLRRQPVRGGRDKGKWTRNSSRSYHEQQQLQKQHGGINRGQMRTSVATRAHRIEVGVRSRQELEPEIQMVQELPAREQGQGTKEEREEEMDKTLTLSQLMFHSQGRTSILSRCNPEITNAFLTIPGYEIQPDLCRDQENTARYRGRIVGILAGRVNYFTGR
jgi:hypothetical protein